VPQTVSNAWLWDYLDEGSPELKVDLDAHWEERQRLRLLEILDIFSQVELPLLEPEFYQGWTDRTVRCQTWRRQVVEIVGSGLDAEQRQGLLVRCKEAAPEGPPPWRQRPPSGAEADRFNWSFRPSDWCRRFRSRRSSSR